MKETCMFSKIISCGFDLLQKLKRSEATQIQAGKMKLLKISIFFPPPHVYLKKEFVWN